MPTIYIKENTELPERKKHDFYPTPVEFCRAVVNDAIPPRFNNYGLKLRVLDPGAGDGVWGKAIKERFPLCKLYGVEIRDVDRPRGYNYWYRNTDYSKGGKYGLDWLRGFDIIIGNPPYKYGEEFLDKGLEQLRDNGILLFLLKLPFLESKKRYEKYFSGMYRPAEVYVSVRRISFTGDKKSNSDAYAMFVWKKNKSYITTLRWLDWDYNE